MKINEVIAEPAHEHDCDACIFVGADSPIEGEPRTNQVDMYVHPPTSQPHSGTLLRRYGSEGPHYSSVPLGVFKTITGPSRVKYERVFAAAKEHGIL